MKFLNFLLGGLWCLIFQLFFGGILYFTFRFIAIFFPENSAPLIIETIIFAGIYGAGWFIYWKMRSVLGIKVSLNSKELIWYIFMAMLPIIILLIIFNPIPYPDAMIPISFEEYRYIFTLYVTTLLVYPIYSFLLNRYVFSSKTSQSRKTTITVTFIFLLGISCAYISWSIMPLIYKSY